MGLPATELAPQLDHPPGGPGAGTYTGDLHPPETLQERFEKSEIGGGHFLLPPFVHQAINGKYVVPL